MLQEQYKFLDQRQPPSTLVNKDQALASSTAFAHFLNILAKQEEEEGSNVDQMKHIQKEFSEMFTNWSRLSQLSVGFMMYLDSRIEADSYLIKVNAIHTLSPRSGEEFNFPGNQAPGQWQPL